ncbi:MAG: virulence RhuM family protein [Steroidobacteraceae bacterium]
MTNKKPPKDLIIRNSTAEFLMFTSQTGENGIAVRYEDETIWLTQKLMAELFDVSIPTVNEHLKNIFDSKELNPSAVIRNFRTTAADGKNYDTNFYNLDAIISVGYRVNSVRATQFRQWATKVLREFAVKGYVLDRRRLENGSFLGEDYFERLLAEIREIRLSERRFYQKITDIYATSVDYNKDAPTTRDFFAKVQNKLHFAIHGHTAAELIVKRADCTKDHMGLTSWENSPDGKVLKTDVAVAKNYLTTDELESLARIVNAYLDLAEDRARRKIPMTMEDWAKRLDDFLKFDDRAILQNAGAISADLARTHAESEFEKYRIVQDRLFESDFDKSLNALEHEASAAEANVISDGKKRKSGGKKKKDA